VRELPLSRRAGFSKTALSAALGEAGVAYEHVRALGNPKPIREIWRAGEVDEGKRAYRAYLESDGAAAVDELADSLEPGTCLLCLERDPADCHRTIVAAAVAARVPGLSVVEL
jgi:uncharacterized protein (DUF488 family)